MNNTQTVFAQNKTDVIKIYAFTLRKPGVDSELLGMMQADKLEDAINGFLLKHSLKWDNFVLSTWSHWEIIKAPYENPPKEQPKTVSWKDSLIAAIVGSNDEEMLKLNESKLSEQEIRYIKQKMK